MSRGWQNINRPYFVSFNRVTLRLISYFTTVFYWSPCAEKSSFFIVTSTLAAYGHLHIAMESGSYSTAKLHRHHFPSTEKKTIINSYNNLTFSLISALVYLYTFTIKSYNKIVIAVHA